MLDRLNDYNWEKVFEAAGQEHKDGYNYRDNPVNLSRAVPTDTTTPVTEFTREDVAEILHIEDGENDEQDWIAVVRLADGRFAYLEGGCDYTGWDCQSGCCAIVAENYEDIVRFGCSESARTRFGIEIDGEEARRTR